MIYEWANVEREEQDLIDMDRIGQSNREQQSPDRENIELIIA